MARIEIGKGAMKLISELIAALGNYVPHDMFSLFVPTVQAVVVLGQVVLLYAYLLTALTVVLRRLFGAAFSKSLFLYSLAGFFISLSGPFVAYGISNKLIPQAWEGAWHVAAIVPLLMLLARVAARPAEAASNEEPLDTTQHRAGEWERIMSLLSHTSDGLLTVSREGRIEMMNASAEKLLGVREKEIVGQPLTFLAEKVKFYTEDHQPIPVQDWAVTRALREGTIANEQSVQLFPFRSKGIYLNLSASPLRGIKGAMESIVCVLKDVTAQRQLEMLKDELFSRVPLEEGKPEVKDAPAQREIGRSEPDPAAAPAESVKVPGAVETTASFLKSFLWEQSTEATRMGVSFLDQIPSVLPPLSVPTDRLKKALAAITEYAFHATASGGMVRLWASAKEDKIFIAIRDGGMGMIADEVTRFTDYLDTLYTGKGDQQRNPLYPLIVAKEELAALGLQLQVRSDGLKKGTEYYILIPAAGSGEATKKISVAKKVDEEIDYKG